MKNEITPEQQKGNIKATIERKKRCIDILKNPSTLKTKGEISNKNNGQIFRLENEVAELNRQLESIK